MSLGRKLLLEGRDVLAVPVGVSRSEFVLTKLAELRKLPAHVVRAGQVDSWRFEGVVKHEQRLYLHGPYLPGRFLEQVVANSFSAALPYLSRLIQALLVLKRGGQLPEFIQTDSVYFLADGGVLFLPPALMRELRSMHPEPFKIRVFETINHPDITDPEQALSYSLAALLYRIILGHYPFEAQSEEEIHNRIRNARLLPPSLVEPGLREALSDTLLAGLKRGGEPMPSIEGWQETVAACRQKGVHRDITEMERREIQRRAEQELKRIQSAYRRRVFWQKHTRTVIIAAAALVAVGLLTGSLLRTVLAPRQTRGLSPRQIVETFYGGMNQLDHALMEDCVVEGAGKAMIREVMNIYVLSRVSLGYEGRSNIVPADQWDSQGRPPLEAPLTVYGVSGLELVREQGEPEPVYRVRYTKWTPQAAGDGQSEGAAAAAAQGPVVSSREISERLYLRLDRQDWVIYRIEPL